MEPNLTSPQFNPERAPAFTPSSPEVLPAQNPETTSLTPERGEQLSRATQAAVSAVAAPTLPVPVAQPVTSDDTASTVIVGTPAVAADDDLIEKEWVDKAKKIILETQNDPHGREEAVGQLQRDYLRKRYGKEIGAADE